MNILSFILAIAAVVVFALAARGYRHASIAVGLALVTAAWMLQLLWTGADLITL